MQIYDLVNMSDAITFKAPTRLIATLVTTVLGGGQYGATAIDENGEEDKDAGVPIFMFGGFEAFMASLGETGPTEGMADRYAAELIPALRSVTLGSVADRRLYDSALEAIDDPVKSAAFISNWNDIRRSSLNDIMGRAHKIADKLEAALETGSEPSSAITGEDRPPQQVFTAQQS